MALQQPQQQSIVCDDIRHSTRLKQSRDNADNCLTSPPLSHPRPPLSPRMQQRPQHQIERKCQRANSLLLLMRAPSPRHTLRQCNQLEAQRLCTVFGMRPRLCADKNVHAEVQGGGASDGVWRHA